MIHLVTGSQGQSIHVEGKASRIRDFSRRRVILKIEEVARNRRLDRRREARVGGDPEAVPHHDFLARSKHGALRPHHLDTGGLDPDAGQKLPKNGGSKLGVVVSGIFANSQAERRGLQIGDAISAINGIALESKIQFEEIISEVTRGGSIFLLVIRGKEKFHMILNN